MTKQQIEQLKSPFNDDVIGIKPQSFNKKINPTKVMLVQVLQHTDVANRLDEVDPGWSFLCSPAPDGAKAVYGTLTVCGASRSNVGEGDDPKAAASDCLKRCAMLFGVGRYLYDEELVWVPYNEATDKYKKWTIEDYRRASKAGPAKSKPAKASVGKITPKPEPEFAPAMEDLPPPIDDASWPDSAADYASPDAYADLGPANHAPTGPGLISEKQAKRMYAIAVNNGWTGQSMNAHLKKAYGIAKAEELPKSKYEDAVKHFESNEQIPF